MHLPPRIACVLAWLAIVAAAAGQLTPVHPDTGQDRRVWPPARPFDHLHMRLEIVVPDMMVDAFRADERLLVEARGESRSAIALDAGPALRIGRVRVDGQDATYRHEDARLHIDLASPVDPGERIEIRIEYEAENPGDRGQGLTWVGDDPDTDESDPMFHSQGQPETNHLWFVCHDFPDERMTTELIVDVPIEFEAVSNGRLARIGQAGERRIYHWSQDRPHPAYLVTLVIGRFSVVNLGGPETGRPHLWMPVYGPVGAEELLQRQFGDTPAIMAWFEERLDEPFPWDKYAQVVARRFPGAMENTSASTFGQRLVRAPASFIERFIVHELVHQWFGDLVTCASWEHLWLNEGWASYGEAMWAEHRAGRRAYMNVIREFRSSQLSFGTEPAPGARAMTSHLYLDPDERFGNGNSVYDKGALILHMLRQRLGDDVFWRATRLYLDRFRDRSVETADFRRVLEEVSGRSLERFFDQWVYRPGHPRIELDYAWDADSGRLDVTLLQTQTIDHLNPAFVFDLPLGVRIRGEDELIVVNLRVDGRSASGSFELPGPPDDVLLDPEITVIVDPTVRHDLADRAPSEGDRDDS